MKYLKTFEDSFYDEYPGLFKKPESPESVPGFEDGTIDPEEEECEINGKKFKSGIEEYEKFLIIVKERNFKETPNEIIINIRGIVNDYCMSIYNFGKYAMMFFKEELIGKYISDGFKNLLTDEKHEGLIENVNLTYINDMDCTILLNLKLKDQKLNVDNFVENIIKINKTKTYANKFNL